MDLRILGFVVFLLIVLSGGAAIPLLGFSAVVYLLVFLVHVGSEVWQGVSRRGGHNPRRVDEPC